MQIEVDRDVFGNEALVCVHVIAMVRQIANQIIVLSSHIPAVYRLQGDS